MPVARWPYAGKRWRGANTGCVHPPQTAPGLGPPRTRTGRGYSFSYQNAGRERMMSIETIPACSSAWWGPDRAGPPRDGATLTTFQLLVLLVLVLLLANFLTSALASER